VHNRQTVRPPEKKWRSWIATPARKPYNPDEKPQIERFREMALELGCDEDQAAFDAALRKIAAAGPPKKYEPKKARPKS
jgi:hypothetical protein